MNKITSGILGLVAAVSLVSAVAYAAFSDTVTINGMSVSVAGDADLKIQGNFNGTILPDPPAESLDIVALTGGAQPLQTLSPGESDWAHIILHNDSDDFALSLKAQLMNGVVGDWNAFKDVVTIEVFEVDAGGTDISGGDHVIYTLANWNSEARDLPGDPIPANGSRQFKAVFMLDVNAGNDVAGEVLSGINFQIVGTQVVPAP